MLEASLYMIHAMIVHEMATWETARAKQRRRRHTRSRRRRAHVGHGVRIVVQDGWLPLAAAALHQLQRVLPELQKLLACDGLKARTARTFAAPLRAGVSSTSGPARSQAEAASAEARARGVPPPCAAAAWQERLQRHGACARYRLAA